MIRRQGRRLHTVMTVNALQLGHDDPRQRGSGSRDGESRYHAATEQIRTNARRGDRRNGRRRKYMRFGLETRRERVHERAAGCRTRREIVGTQGVADQVEILPRRAILLGKPGKKLTDVARTVERFSVDKSR